MISSASLHKVAERFGQATGNTTLTLKGITAQLKDVLKQDRIANAGHAYCQALDKVEKVLQDHPNSSSVNRTFAQISFDYACWLQAKDDLPEAGKYYEQAIKHGRKAENLKQDQEETEDLLRKIGIAGREYCHLLKERGEAAQADRMLQDFDKLIEQTSTFRIAPNVKGFFSPPAVVLSQQNISGGNPSFSVNNVAFENYLQGLGLCTQPFFHLLPPLSVSTQPYSLPQPGESIQETRHLAWCITHGSHEESKSNWISHAYLVVEQFKGLHVKRLAHIQEIVALAAIDHPGLYREITDAFLDALKPEVNRLLRLSLLRGLSVMIFHRTHLKGDYHSESDCIKILTSLTQLLERTPAHGNAEQISTLLQTISLLLDQMVYLQVRELDRVKVEEPLKKALSQFSDREKYPELAWLLESTQQALRRLPNNETVLEEVFRRALPALSGAAYLTTFGLKVASSIPSGGIMGGLELDKLWDAYQSFKEAFSEITRSRYASWYEELRYLDFLMTLGRLDLFNQRLPKNPDQCNEQYVYGLCDRLERLACVQSSSDTQDSALRLLQSFKNGGIDWADYEGVKRYAGQKLNRLALMWPTPKLSVMEREEYAPAAWHSFWSAAPGNELLKQAQQKIKPSLLELRSSLYEHYQPSLSIQRVSGEIMGLEECYINLAIVESQTQKKGRTSLDNQAKTFARLPSSEQTQLISANYNKPITLESLFASQKLRDGSTGIPKKILIYGRAGIGKTTLCKKIEDAYQTKQLWRDRFEAVLWVPLRQLKRDENKYFSLETMLTDYYFNHAGKRIQLAQLLLENKDKTLFILDGLDEVADKLGKSDPVGKFLTTLMNQKHVVMTSRPSGVDISQLGQLDLELETIGFSPENVDAYITKFVKDANTVEAIKAFIKHTPLIQGLVNIPIQLDALCFSWNKLPKNQTVTMASLYDAMVRQLWLKDSKRLEKRKSGENLTDYKLEKRMDPVTHSLGYLAFKGLETGEIEFSWEDLSQCERELDEIGGIDIEAYTLKNTSLLHTADAKEPDEEKRSYHFLHLTFQEFFAAKWIVRHIAAYWSPTVKSDATLVLSKQKLITFIQQHKYNPRYEIVWRMVAGLLKDEAAEAFINILEQSPRDLTEMRHQQMVMECLNEARTQLKTATVKRLEASLMQWLRFEMESRKDDWLIELGSKATFPEHLLLKCFDDPKSDKKKIIRTLEARQVLSDNAISTLISALQDKDENVRSEAVSVLGGKNNLPESAVLTLTTALWDKSWIVRDAAASALRAYNTLPKSAFAALNLALEDNDNDVRDRAVSVLGGYETLPEFAISALITDLVLNENKSIRSMAARRLGIQKTLPDAALSALVSALRDKDMDVRSEAAMALKMLSFSPKSLPEATILALISTLHGDFKYGSVKALEVLSVQNELSEVILSALISTLQDKDKDEDMRSQSAAALASKTTGLPEKAISALNFALDDRSKSVRFKAAVTLNAKGAASEMVFSVLIAALQDKNEVVRSEASWALATQEALPEKAISALISTLQGGIEDGRAKAIRVLAAQEMLSEAALFALISALQDKNEVVRFGASRALVTQKALPEKAISALISTLQGDIEDGRVEATTILAAQKVPLEAALFALISALQDKNRDVRFEASRALATQKALPEKAISALISTLQGNSEYGKVEALEVLSAQKVLSETVLSSLISALFNKSESVRSKAAQVLEAQKALSEPSILSALGDDGESVKFPVAGLLDAHKALPETTIFSLISALQDKNQSVRSAVTWLLEAQETLPEVTIPALISALQDKNQSVRSAVTRLLKAQETLPEVAIPALISTLRNNSEYVRSAAAWILGFQKTLPEAILLNLVSALQDENENGSFRSAAARVLGFQKTFPETILSTLIAALQDENGSGFFRSAVARALDLQKALPNDTISALISALKDENRSLRIAAAGLLGAQETLSENAILALVSALWDENELVRSEASWALGVQKSLPATALSTLISTLRDENKNESVRYAITRVLGMQKALPEAAISALSLALDNENKTISSGAARALVDTSIGIA